MKIPEGLKAEGAWKALASLGYPMEEVGPIVAVMRRENGPWHTLACPDAVGTIVEVKLGEVASGMIHGCIKLGTWKESRVLQSLGWKTLAVASAKTYIESLRPLLAIAELESMTLDELDRNTSVQELSAGIPGFLREMRDELMEQAQQQVGGKDYQRSRNLRAGLGAVAVAAAKRGNLNSSLIKADSWRAAKITLGQVIKADLAWLEEVAASEEPPDLYKGIISAVTPELCAEIPVREAQRHLKTATPEALSDLAGAVAVAVSKSREAVVTEKWKKFKAALASTDIVLAAPTPLELSTPTGFGRPDPSWDEITQTGTRIAAASPAIAMLWEAISGEAGYTVRASQRKQAELAVSLARANPELSPEAAYRTAEVILHKEDRKSTKLGMAAYSLLKWITWHYNDLRGPVRVFPKTVPSSASCSSRFQGKPHSPE